MCCHDLHRWSFYEACRVSSSVGPGALTGRCLSTFLFARKPKLFDALTTCRAINRTFFPPPRFICAALDYFSRSSRVCLRWFIDAQAGNELQSCQQHCNSLYIDHWISSISLLVTPQKPFQFIETGLKVVIATSTSVSIKACSKDYSYFASQSSHTHNVLNTQVNKSII